GTRSAPATRPLRDEERRWYYRDEKALDRRKRRGDHQARTAALRADGTGVVPVGGAPADPKAMYTRDNAIAVAGGAIICRMGPVGARPGQGRRGEEAFVTRKLAEIGMPILRTIHGTGLFEGGSFCWLNEHTAL